MLTATRQETNVTANKSVSAKFALNTYTLTYRRRGQAITGPASQTVNYGANGSAVTAVPNADYHFVQWSDGSRPPPRTDSNVDRQPHGDGQLRRQHILPSASPGGADATTPGVGP